MKSILILFLCIFLVGCRKDVVSRDEYDENIIQGYVNKIETDIIEFWGN